MVCFSLPRSIKDWIGPYQGTPKEVARAIRYSGLGVRNPWVPNVGDFLDMDMLVCWSATYNCNWRVNQPPPHRPGLCVTVALPPLRTNRRRLRTVAVMASWEAFGEVWLGQGDLVGGWTNPSEKYARQIGKSSPILGVKINKILEKPPPKDDTGDLAEDRWDLMMMRHERMIPCDDRWFDRW